MNITSNQNLYNLLYNTKNKNNNPASFKAKLEFESPDALDSLELNLANVEGLSDKKKKEIPEFIEKILNNFEPFTDGYFDGTVILAAGKSKDDPLNIKFRASDETVYDTGCCLSGKDLLGLKKDFDLESTDPIEGIINILWPVSCNKKIIKAVNRDLIEVWFDLAGYNSFHNNGTSIIKSPGYKSFSAHKIYPSIDGDVIYNPDKEFQNAIKTLNDPNATKEASDEAREKLN